MAVVQVLVRFLPSILGRLLWSAGICDWLNTTRARTAAFSGNVVAGSRHADYTLRNTHSCFCGQRQPRSRFSANASSRGRAKPDPSKLALQTLLVAIGE